MTSQIISGPQSSSSLIRSDSVFTTGKITLNGNSGNALTILNNATIISNGSALLNALTVTGGIACNNIVITSDTNTMKIGIPSYLNNETFPSLGTTNFTTTNGLSLVNSMTIPDAIQQLDGWINSYLIDTPPALILGTTGSDNDKIFVTWTFPNTVDIGFSDINLPHHTTVVVDYVKTSNNASNNFVHASTVTINTGSKTTNRINIYIDSGPTSLNGNTYDQYSSIIEADVFYDIRVYMKNFNDTKTNKFLIIKNLKTEAIGVPSVPLSISSTTLSSSSFNVTYTKPVDHNNIAAGNNSLPFIERYGVTYASSSSIRFGGVLSQSGITYTPTTIGENAATNLTVSNLNPGVTYSLNVFAINSKNPSFSPAGSASGFTDYPISPTRITSSTVLTFNSNLYAPFTQGGYNLAGTTLFNFIINYNNVNGILNNLDIQTSTTQRFLLNELPSATSPNPVSGITAYGGIQNSLGSASYGFKPFHATPDIVSTEIGGGQIFLGITNNRDHNNSIDIQHRGFWRSSQLYIRGNNNFFVASTNVYEYYYQQTIFSAITPTLSQSQSLIFAVDDINVSPIVSELGFSGIVGNNVNMISYLSGVPSYNSTTDFTYRFNITTLAKNYLRIDKKHGDLVLLDDTIQIGTTSSILQSSIGATHKYYNTTAFPFEISAVLHNTNGLLLLPPVPSIQFNTFTKTIGITQNIYTENLKIGVTGLNLYGSSALMTSRYVNSVGVSQPLRMDLNGINASTSSNATSATFGKQVNSGDNEFPNIYNTNFGINYDNTKNILTDVGYTQELQLINGLYRTPSSTIAFKNYITYFYPTAMSITTPNYSTVSASGFRYSSFKYTRTFSGFKNQLLITIINPVGFTQDFKILNSANYKLYLRVHDPRTLSPGEYTYATNWMSVNNAFGILGINNAANNDGCLSTKNSTSLLRYCYIKPCDSQAIFIIKIGLNSATTQTFENIQLDMI